MANATYSIQPPALLLSAGLLFWGWRAELLPLAIVMATVLEGARFISWRWRFSDKDFNRLVDLTSAILLAFAAYLYATRSIHGIFTLAQWFPVLVFLLVGAQTYSSQATLPLSALLLALRRRKPQQDTHLAQRIDIRFPYLAGCMLAASVVPLRTPWFYAGLCALAAWALWSIRPRRYASALWGGLLMSVIALGYVGHVGLNRLQGIVGDAVIDWLVSSERDPYQTTTAIGHIGQLKLSDRIVLRVKLPERTNRSLLLRQASYNAYASGIWRAAGDRFEAVTETPSPGSWQLGEPGMPQFAINVSGHLHRGRGLVAVPNGSYRIENLPAEFVKRNLYGAIKAENGPGVVSYTVRFRPDVSFDVEPTDKDLHIPSRYQSLFAQVSSELALSKDDPNKALAVLERHFRENFRYSLEQGRNANYAPLSHFLLRSRSGHCEYFATSTALLLRAAGIPTRYATGYSVQEYSELEDAYIVRHRHAHSWVLAYIDGTWRDVDFTPPTWVALEEQAAPWWETLYDLGSRVAFLFSRWRWSERDGQWLEVFLWLLVPLGLILGWRLYFKERIRRARPKKRHSEPVTDRSGRDSAFYRIVHQLERSSSPRRRGETLGQWLQGLTARDASTVDDHALKEALALHYRYRFDPRGLMPEERATLQSRVSEWLARDQ
jgi:transglutaminase-like putative cysteine protease